MPLPLDTSKEAGIVRRAKALGVLLLPIIAFAAIVFLAWAFERLHPAGVATKASNPGRGSNTLSMTSTNASVEVTRTLQGATTVTVYTITPKY